MSRISASGIAGLFYGLNPGTKNPQPKKKSPMPTKGLLIEKIFPHGHVQEHNALTVLRDFVQDIRGQDGFARDREHLDALGAKLQNKETVVSLLSDAWVNQYTLNYAHQLGHDGQLSLEEIAIAQRCIEQIGTELDYLQLPRDVKLEALKQLGAGYTLSNGIVYDVPRFHYDIGQLHLVCQPDGMCTYQGKKMVIEIKSCWGPLYTSLATRSSSNKPISANSNIKKWLYYLVQIAIEMLPPDIEGVVFACFRGNKAAMGRAHVIEQKALNVIVLERKQMQGLIDTVHELLIALEPAAAGASSNSVDPFILWETLEDKTAVKIAYDNVVAELRGPLLASLQTTATDIWQSLYVEKMAPVTIQDEYPVQHLFTAVNNVYRFNKDFTYTNGLQIQLKCEQNDFDSFAVKAYSLDEPIGWVASAKYIEQNMKNMFPSVPLHSNDAVVDIVSHILQATCIDHKHGTVLIRIDFRSFVKRPVRNSK